MCVSLRRIWGEGCEVVVEEVGTGFGGKILADDWSDGTDVEG